VAEVAPLPPKALAARPVTHHVAERAVPVGSVLATLAHDDDPLD